MLIFLRHELAFLATPKTGTTAIEMALKPRAEIIFAKNRKHTPAARYVKKVAPFLAETFGVRPASVAVMREPVAQLRSWYRYRTQDRLDGTEVSTKGISFDQFVRAVIADEHKRARVGRQFNFLTGRDGEVLVDHLFAYEQQDALLSFLSAKLDTPVEIEARNVSPKVDAPLSEETLSLLKASRPEDFALHDKLTAHGGHLTQE